MTEFFRIKSDVAFKNIKGKKVRIVSDEGIIVSVSIVGQSESYRFLRSDLEPWEKTETSVETFKNSKFTLIDGDPFDPLSTDLIAQRINLGMGISPHGDGWRILTGNEHSNLWARIAYRYEIEE